MKIFFKVLAVFLAIAAIIAGLLWLSEKFKKNDYLNCELEEDQIEDE